MSRLKLLIVTPVILETTSETKSDLRHRSNGKSFSETTVLASTESGSSAVTSEPCVKQYQSLDVVETSLGIELLLESTWPDEETLAVSEEIPKRKKFDLLSCVPTHFDRNCFDFPFLTHRKTYMFLNSGDSKVMFIMRGLSGSGKSTLVNIIKSSYKHSVVCSADDYFRTPDGDYKFDEKLLSSAHGDCQQKAKQACRMKIPVVVIDNTNVKKWEMKFYADLANISGYVAVTVQPKTPWKWNAEELAARNKHGVPLEILEKKVKMFDDVVPVYYGWFLTEKKSKCLTRLCMKIFFDCLSNFPGLKNDLLRELGIRHDQIDEGTAKGILLEYYSNSQQGSQGPLLHCTSMFCNRGKVPKSNNYHQRPDVQKACGQLFTLAISGLVITSKTIGARVTLDTVALAFFNRPEEREWNAAHPQAGSSGDCRMNGEEDESFIDQDEDLDPSNGRGKKRGKRKSPPKVQKNSKKNQRVSPEKNGRMKNYSYQSQMHTPVKNAINNECTNLNDIPLDGTRPKADGLEIEAANLNSSCSSGDSLLLSDLCPSLNNSGFARSAHFTIKTARGVGSREVNFDVLHACDVEAASSFTKSNFVPVQRGQACYYGNGLCCVYFENPLPVKTLFSGYY